jgi:hypothetical protein
VRAHVGQPVAGCIGAGARDGLGVLVGGQHRAALACQRQREAAVVGEGVEATRAFGGQGRHQRVVVGLVEKSAGLAVGEQIGG